MIKLYNEGKRITAALKGDIDHHSARHIRQALDEVISLSQPDLLILDMEEVGFMDSSGIGLIIGRMNTLRSFGGDLVIKNARPQLAAVIKLSGLSSLLAEGVKT